MQLGRGVAVWTCLVLTACGGGTETPTAPSAALPDEERSVFPVPSGDVEPVEPYAARAEAGGRTETATFVVRGTQIDAVVRYYRELLPTMGYMVEEPATRTGSVSLTVSDPAAPDVVAVVTVRPTADDDRSVELAQRRWSPVAS